jgi:hypothetical protein
MAKLMVRVQVVRVEEPSLSLASREEKVVLELSGALKADADALFGTVPQPDLDLRTCCRTGKSILAQTRPNDPQEKEEDQERPPPEASDSDRVQRGPKERRPYWLAQDEDWR